MKSFQVQNSSAITLATALMDTTFKTLDELGILYHMIQPDCIIIEDGNDNAAVRDAITKIFATFVQSSSPPATEDHPSNSTTEVCKYCKLPRTNNVSEKCPSFNHLAPHHYEKNPNHLF